MKIGAIYPQIELKGDPEAVRRIGLAVEEMGFDHLLVYDHVVGAVHEGREPRLTGPYNEKDPFHDPFVMFAYLAGITKKIELVTGILILPQRQTVLVARQAADLDLLSNERFRMGIGIGWNPVEYEVLGQDFSTRGKRSEEQIELLRTLWREPVTSFDGSFDKVDRAALNPRPKRQIPIWIGGFADVALKRAAKIGDGFMFADGAGDAFAQIATLKGFLKEEGRSIDGFGLQNNMLKAKGADQVVETALRWRDVGGTHIGINTMSMGLTTIDQHVDYLKTCLDALAKAGL
ncbi:MAG: LLM class F420-dependent oxidoreductase [Sphingomonadales bacterium]|nr:MAG: LLM class F420-dependent oxidoreductase [Sphingomonadales bacterium]